MKIVLARTQDKNSSDAWILKRACPPRPWIAVFMPRQGSAAKDASQFQHNLVRVQALEQIKNNKYEFRDPISPFAIRTGLIYGRASSQFPDDQAHLLLKPVH